MQADVIFALNSKFSLRLDLCRKLVEFASPISAEDDKDILSILADAENVFSHHLMAVPQHKKKCQLKKQRKTDSFFTIVTFSFVGFKKKAQI
jgi:hypothetical protein